MPRRSGNLEKLILLTGTRALAGVRARVPGTGDRIVLGPAFDFALARPGYGNSGPLKFLFCNIARRRRRFSFAGNILRKPVIG